MQDVVVVDNFLPDKDRAAIYELLQEEAFVSAHLKAKRTALREWDGDSRVGPGICSRPVEGDASGQLVMPTNTPYDLFGARVQEFMARDLSGEWLGRYPETWNTFAFRSYRYTPGAGLTWHTDGNYLAAFSYYVHEEWQAHWGGVLLIGRQAPRRAEGHSPVKSFHRYADPQTYGEGKFIAALPNRIVFIRAGVPHCITPVTSAAGDRHRLSLAGFVLPP